MFARAFCILALVCGLTAPVSAQGTDTIVVLDVSNSMWGQIDGVSKIEIARDVIGNLVGELSPETRLGLVAYGHRQKASCTDIETVLPVAPLNARQFSDAVNALVPRGRTPLTDAVRHAAQALNFRDQPGRIILVSDGLESCDADPCALARELTANGVDFTAHVVGFDVGAIADQSQLSCLADITGGKYLTADNAAELAIALQAVSEPDPAPIAPPPLLQLVAVDSNGAPIVDTGIAWTLISQADQNALLSGQRGTSVETSLDFGSYLVRAELNGLTGQLEFSFAANGPHYFEVVLGDSVSLVALSPVEPNATVTVTWAGPNANGDYLAIAPAGSAVSMIESYVRTMQGSPVDMTAPVTAGAYEIRYVSAVRGEILASIPLDVSAAVIRLTAPDEVSAGAGFTVDWMGPNLPGDAIILTPLNAPAAQAVAQVRTADGNPAILLAPEMPGNFQLHYLDNTGQLLASEPLAVIIPATLEAMPVIAAGADLTVSWTGPDTQGDYINMVPIGSPDNESGNYTYTREGTPLTLRADDVPGAYELRYITGRERAVIAVLPITVTETQASLDASPIAGTGAEISVTWTGPDNQNDYIAIVPMGSPDNESGNYTYTREGSPLDLLMPPQEGAFEIRYITGQDRLILARLPITLQAGAVTLAANPVGQAGAEIEVSWSGPDNRNDYITIVPVGADQGETGNYTYTREGSPLSVRTPDIQGSFEIRYVAGQGRATLASLPLTLQAVSVSLSAQPSAAAGSNIMVTWDGPDNRNDYITIVPAGAPRGQSDNYTYTREGSPLELRTADSPGNYEIRYVSGQSRDTLASIPITLVADVVTLNAEARATAGADISVTWAGPDNQNDYIVIVPTGAEEGVSGNYTYTREGSPLTIRTPDYAGTYEIRYVSGQSRSTRATQMLSLSSAAVSIGAPPSAGAGTKVSINWEGPDNHNDAIAIVPVGAEEREYGAYSYTRNGSPAEITAPDVAGRYEIRYISGQSRIVLARQPLTLTDTAVVLSIAPELLAGSQITVEFDGPNGDNDYLTLVPAGSREGAYVYFYYTRSGSPGTLTVPDEPGNYELRYVSGQNARTMASVPVVVTGLEIYLDAPETTTAGSMQTVLWDGPDYNGDFLTIVPVGSPVGFYVDYFYTSGDSPALIRVPDTTGPHEIRYISGQSSRTLGSRPIMVE